MIRWCLPIVNWQMSPNHINRHLQIDDSCWCHSSCYLISSAHISDNCIIKLVTVWWWLYHMTMQQHVIGQLTSETNVWTEGSITSRTRNCSSLTNTWVHSSIFGAFRVANLCSSLGFGFLDLSVFVLSSTINVEGVGELDGAQIRQCHAPFM